MLKETVKKLKKKLGFTLLEAVAVIGVIAVASGIAIPSIISISNNSKLTQGNDYAKAIYMAAQNNLTQMRGNGELGLLGGEMGAAKADQKATNCAAGEKYLVSKTGSQSYDLIVPGTLDSTIRNQQVLVEYHPDAGIVYSVFYYEGKEDLESLYANYNDTIRNGDLKDRRKLKVGYYSVQDVDALEVQEFTVYHTSASIGYENGQECMVTVEIPIMDNGRNVMFSDQTQYIKGLEVDLVIAGENGGKFTATYTNTTETPFTYDNKESILVEIPLDSLKVGGSFLDKLQAQNQPEQNQAEKIAAGDNVTVTADVTFYPTKADDPIIVIESATVADVNPMFHGLTQNPQAGTAGQKDYILSISNGRHLQNLASLDKIFAQKIDTVVFTESVTDPAAPAAQTGETWVFDWAETAAYYNKEDLKLIPASLSGVNVDGNGVEIRNLAVSEAVNGNIGLFAELSKAKVENINLVDPAVTGAATKAGALIGKAVEVTVSDCQVTHTGKEADSKAIIGRTDVGGLVGYAEDCSFTDCTTGANVRGADSSRSSLGGLAGTAKASDFENCSAEKVLVVSGEDHSDTDNKNALGGLVGSSYADGSTDSTFDNCSVNSESRIISSEDSCSDLGGFVGHAQGSEFTDCSSAAQVSGTRLSYNAVPNNNLGGFVGKTEQSDYNGITVRLNYLPQHAEDAGGFAGLLYGGEVNDLDVSFSEGATGEATVKNFGGIASICDNGAVLQDVSVAGSAPFNNATDKVGGAFNVIDGTTTISEARVEIASLSAQLTSGFAIATGNGVTIRDSYVWGVVGGTGNRAGFVHDNSGTIDGCFANVTMNAGAPFVAANGGGSVKNCYGWVWGRSGTDCLKITQNCSYSYFVNGYDAVGNGRAMVMYEGVGEISENITDTEALTDSWAVDILNLGKPSNAAQPRWVEGSDAYPYPRLTGIDHVGDYTAPIVGNYPYALMYVENYSDETSGTQVVWYGTDGTVKITSDTLGTGAIESVEYYLCHRTSSTHGDAYLDRNDGDQFTAAMKNFGFQEASKLYSIYQLENNSDDYYDYLGLHTFFPLYGAVNQNIAQNMAYQIRTGEQFANIFTSGTYYVSRNITVTESIPSFAGSLAGTASTVTVTASVPLVEKLTGGEIKNLTVTGAVSGNGAVAAEVTGGTITNVNSTATVSGTGEAAGMFAGTVTGGSFVDCQVNATNSGNLPFARFAMEEVTGVTHTYTQQLSGKLYLGQDAWKNFAGVSGTKQERVASGISVSGCTLNGHAAVTAGVHFYKVDTDKILAETYESSHHHSYNVVEVSPSYSSLVQLWTEAANPAEAVPTNYYAVSGTSYYRLHFKVTKTTAEIPPEAEGGEITYVTSYAFDFVDSANKDLAEDVTVAENNLGDPVAVTLYVVETKGNPFGVTGGDYLLYCDAGALNCAGGNIGTSAVPEDVTDFLWVGDGQGNWTGYGKNSSQIISTVKNGTPGNNFDHLTKINTTISTIKFYVERVATHYHYEYLGTGSAVYYPGT